MIDESYLKNRRVFVHILAAFRYGREDLDVLGLSFRKDLFLASTQIYPPQQSYLNDLPTNPIPTIAVASNNVSSKEKNPCSNEEERSVDPAVSSVEMKPLTRLQERLIKKLGPSAYPFYFEVWLIIIYSFCSFHSFTRLYFEYLFVCFQMLSFRCVLTR